MTKHLMAAVLGLLVACGSNAPKTKTGSGSGTSTAVCAPTDCGAEPPISPSVCAEGAAVSTSCTRADSGTCERKILCDGKEAAASTAPAAPQ